MKTIFLTMGFFVVAIVFMWLSLIFAKYKKKKSACACSAAGAKKDNNQCCGAHDHAEGEKCPAHQTKSSVINFKEYKP